MSKKLKDILKKFKIEAGTSCTSPPLDLSARKPYRKSDGKIYMADYSGNEARVVGTHIFPASTGHISMGPLTNKTISSNSAVSPNNDEVEKSLEIHIKNTIHNMREVSTKEYADKYENILSEKMYRQTGETLDNDYYITRGYDNRHKPMYVTVSNNYWLHRLKCFVHNDFFVFEELGS